MSKWLVDRVTGVLERRSSRRGFLVRTAIVGSALVVDPVDYVLHPGTAYGVVCTCGDASCGCGSACCDGYTEFCCTIGGSNTCPSGTVAGGWWRADGSTFCGGGPRYYIDCHGECESSSSSSSTAGFCADDGLQCGCALDDCRHRVAGCVTFRYGQCHQEIPVMGRIACRVVTCTPAYLLDNACTSDAKYDDATAQHNAPCLQARPSVRRIYGPAITHDDKGAWLVFGDGRVYTFGSAPYLGAPPAPQLKGQTVGIAPHPDGGGYWIVGEDGAVYGFGSSGLYGSMAGLHLNAPVVAITPTASGKGYWLVASDGGIFAFGDARFFGSCGSLSLQQPVVGLAPHPDGQGYWMVAADGGVFAFGSATFHGSRGGLPLGNLIGGIVPSATGLGYWLWGQDGAVFAYGDAIDLGDYPRMEASKRDLPSDGIDAFYGMGLRADAGYTLWATAPLGPPPELNRYEFLPAGTTGSPPTTPPTLLPPLPRL